MAHFKDILSIKALTLFETAIKSKASRVGEYKPNNTNGTASSYDSKEVTFWTKRHRM